MAAAGPRRGVWVLTCCLLLAAASRAAAAGDGYNQPVAENAAWAYYQ